MKFDDWGIKETAVEEDGKLTIHKSQDVQSLLDRNKAEADVASKSFGDAGFRKVGSIPMVLAENWAKECGCAVGTAGFAAHVKKKLMDGDYAKLLVHGY
jgi:hypothetical protein